MENINQVKTFKDDFDARLASRAFLPRYQLWIGTNEDDDPLAAAVITLKEKDLAVFESGLERIAARKSVIV